MVRVPPDQPPRQNHTRTRAVNEITTRRRQTSTIEDPSITTSRHHQIPVNEKKGRPSRAASFRFAATTQTRSCRREFPPDKPRKRHAIRGSHGHLVFTTVLRRTLHDVLGRFLSTWASTVQFCVRPKLHHGPAFGSRSLREFKRPKKYTTEELTKLSSTPPTVRYNFKLRGAAASNAPVPGSEGAPLSASCSTYRPHPRNDVDRRPTS